MVKCLFSILLVFFCLKVKCQVNSDLVIAKYKNGIYYVGERIVERENIITLKINTMDTLHINRNLLSRYHDSESALIFPNGKYLQTKGRVWDLTFGFNALGVLNSADQRVSTHLEFMYGKRLSEKLNFGFGLGFEFNEAKVAGFQFDTQFTSLFAYGKYYLNNNSNRLFLFSRIGVGAPTDENEEGITAEHSSGFNSLNGLGLHFASRKSSTFQIMLGFYIQKTSGREFFIDNIGNEVETNFDILIKRLMFKFGWAFG
jgi:hypothetical protein